MIPSDHFVRFYNEVFKFLESRGEGDLEAYWLTISRHQERELIPLFREKGFPGMKAYWDRIAFEENCDLETKYDDRHFELSMRKCPSLTKAMDNDAGATRRYCDHCPGWIGPIMDKLGFYAVYDMKSRTVPQCRISVFACRGDAENAEREAQLPAAWPGKWEGPGGAD